MSYHFSFQRRSEGREFTSDELDAVNLPGIRFERMPPSANTEVFKLTAEGAEAGVYLTEGDLWTERLDDAQLKAVAEFASLIDCVLVGEEGEVYDSTGNVIATRTPIDQEQGEVRVINGRLWGFLFIVALCVIGLIISYIKE